VADYSAKIKLIVDGLQSLKQVEERLTNLNRLAALDLGKAVKGTRTFGAVKKEVDDLAGSFSNLGKIVRGIAVGTGLGALTTSINGLSQAATALKFGGISKFAAALAAATGPAAGLFKELSALAIQFPIVAGTATVAGAALLAFSPQILRAGNATLRLAKAAAEAGQPLSRLMASLASSGFRVDMFIDATQAVKIYQSRLRELSETVSVLSARQTALQTTLNKFNSESDTAAKIAGKLVDVTKRLNTEQQAQNDLLREAAGLRPESVERRATNTYNVTQRRKGFEADQAADIEVVNQALDKLNRRNINWADALGISAMDAAAQKAEQLTARFIKNDKVVDSWITALYEGKQALAEINRTMEVERLDSYTRAVLAQQRALDLYTDTATQAKRAAEALNYAGETPALRPAGFTDEDVRIKNLIDDENTVANLIANNRKTQAALQSGLDAKFFAQQIEYTQKELNAELDKIETTVQAQLKADRRVQKDFDARLAARGKAKEGRNAMMQNAMIGGAFPMLFGGGAGAVLGGAAGGFIPGNPMMSIVTSALGTMVDQFVAGVTEMGVAVKDLVGNFDKLKEANLFVSKQQEFYIQKLIESGRVQEAANAIQQRLIDIIGTQGVQDLDNAGQASTRLNKALAELGIQMQALIAGPLGVIIDRIAAAVALPAASNTATAVQQQLVKQGDKAAAGELGSRVQEIEQRPSLQLGLGAKEAAQDITKLTTAYSQLLKKTETNASISLVDREKTIKQAEQIFTELRDKERAQQELKRQNAEQYADLVRSLQRQQADLNLQYERRAQDLRISNAEKQLDLVKAIGDAQLQQLQNESRARQIDAGGGTGLAAEIATALDTYDIELKRIGQEAADAEQRAKLNILKLDIENERFKLDNAKAIARTNLDNQLRIQRINEQINRQNAELSRRNYEQDISTASINLVNIRADAQANKTIAQAALAQRTVTEDQRAYYTAILKGFEQVLQETEKATEQVARGFIKPSPLPAMAAAPSLQQPGTAAIDAQVNKYKELIAQLTAIETGQNRVNAETAAYLTLVEKTTQFVTQFEAQTVTIENEIEARKLRNRLALEGVAPERIEGELRILELTRAYTQTIGVLDAKLQQLLPVKIENTNEAYQAALGHLAELEALGPLTKAQEELRKKLQDIVDLRERLGTAVATSADNARTTAAAQVQTPQEKIEERIGALKKELADLTNVGNIAITVADGIGTAFGDSFKGIISGSMTAKEALASFFTSVADMFLDMAAQIIAKMITMAILNAVLGVLPGAGGGLGTAVIPEVGAIGQGSSIFAAANGATFSNGIATFARGGAFTNSIVGSPTMFKFADGGAMRTGLMGEAGPEAIMPLTRGPGGQLGVSNFGGGGDVNVVVNVDAKGSSVEGNEQGANQLGRVISAAVQSELIKQQRPGGILAR
jgi:hypothetical protein